MLWPLVVESQRNTHRHRNKTTADDQLINSVIIGMDTNTKAMEIHADR